MEPQPTFDPNKPFTKVSKGGPPATTTPEEPIPSFDPNKPYQTLKKKEPTVENVSPGSNVSSEQPKQDGNLSAPIIGNPADPLGIGEVVAKTVYSGFAHQLPSAVKTFPALSTETYEDYLYNTAPSEEKQKLGGKLFRDKLLNLDISGALTYGDKEIKDQLIKDRISEMGSDVFEAEKKKYTTEKIQKSLEARKATDVLTQERERLLGGIPQSYKDVKGPHDALKYVSYQFGQALPTMVAAAATPGVGSYVLEATDSYNENVDETAKVLSQQEGKKITPQDVIARGLDTPAKEIASNVGLINAALDVGGLGSIVGAARKIFTKELAKETAKKALSSKLLDVLKNPLFVESITEPMQEFNTVVGSKIASGKPSDEAAAEAIKEYPRYIDAAIGGLVGAGGAKVIMSPGQVVRETTSSINSNDINAADQAAEKIESATLNQPEEGVQNAVSIGSTTEVPVGQTSGNSSQVGTGISKPEELTGTQEETQRPDEGSQEEVKAPSVFSQAADLYYQMKDAEGGVKKRNLAQQRRELLDANPSQKYIDDNLPYIYSELEKRNEITKRGDCP